MGLFVVPKERAIKESGLISVFNNTLSSLLQQHLFLNDQSDSFTRLFTFQGVNSHRLLF